MLCHIFPGKVPCGLARVAGKPALLCLSGLGLPRGLSISSESHFCAAENQNCHWGWCIWVSFAGDRRVHGNVLCLLQCSCHCLPWLSGVPLDQLEPSSCMELRAKRRSLPFLGSQRWMKAFIETGASAGPAPVPRLLWQPEILGNTEIRKALAQLVELNTTFQDHIWLNQGTVLTVVLVVSHRH